MKKQRLFAIVKTADGKIERREVRRTNDMCKVYDGYVKSINGLYVPKILREYKKDVLGYE